MKLTIPITKMFLENRSKMEPLVDALEFKGTTFECSSPKACLFHSHINFSYPRLPEIFDKEGVSAFLNRNGINNFSFHIGLSDDTYAYIPIRHEPLSGRVLPREEFFRVAGQNLDFLRSRITGVIAAENLDYIEGGAYEYVCDPHFINEFIHRFDLAFLLDIGHLQVVAKILGYDPEEYLRALPLECLYEIHLHRPATNNGIWRDLHQLPTDEEYKILKIVLERAKPEYLNLECYENPEELIRHLKFMRSNFF